MAAEVDSDGGQRRGRAGLATGLVGWGTLGRGLECKKLPVSAIRVCIDFGHCGMGGGRGCKGKRTAGTTPRCWATTPRIMTRQRTANSEQHSKQRAFHMKLRGACPELGVASTTYSRCLRHCGSPLPCISVDAEVPWCWSTFRQVPKGKVSHCRLAPKKCTQIGHQIRVGACLRKAQMHRCTGQESKSRLFCEMSAE
jgi:hypothetical protein